MTTATASDPRWALVRSRDATADGRFVYAVATTGVYCRPSCPSRAARPENVSFYETPALAEHAGYRPCKRCRPGEPSLAERRAARIVEVCRYIEEASEPPSLAELARLAGMSPHHLHRTFERVTGLSPKAYAAAHRERRVREALAKGETVTSALYDAGYASSGRFYADAAAVLGMTPTAYKRGGAEVVIRFAVGESSLGSVLVAATSRGVCAILMGDDPEALVHDLERRFPRAELVGDDDGFAELVARVVALVERPWEPADLPLDIRGTAFQKRVWRALRAIPAGRTRTYSEIARALGDPDATRAVAGACAANPLAVAIPCHRVVRTDGAPSGYRWGLERKRALLERELMAPSRRSAPPDSARASRARAGARPR